MQRSWEGPAPGCVLGKRSKSTRKETLLKSSLPRPLPNFVSPPQCPLFSNWGNKGEENSSLHKQITKLILKTYFVLNAWLVIDRYGHVRDKLRTLYCWFEKIYETSFELSISGPVTGGQTKIINMSKLIMVKSVSVWVLLYDQQTLTNNKTSCLAR